MRHVSRVTAYFKCVHQKWLSHISDHPLLVCKFVVIYKHPLTSQSTNALWPAFLAKILQTMGTPAINAGASHSRWIPAPQAYFFGRVIARRRATLREFSAGFSSFYTFGKWCFWRTHVWHMCNYCCNFMRGWVDLRNFLKKVHFIHKVWIHIKMKSRLQHPLKTNNR